MFVVGNVSIKSKNVLKCIDSNNFSNWIKDHWGFAWVVLQNDPCQHWLLYYISHWLLGLRRHYGYSSLKGVSSNSKCYGNVFIRLPVYIAVLQHVYVCLFSGFMWVCVCVHVYVFINPCFVCVYIYMSVNQYWLARCEGHNSAAS